MGFSTVTCRVRDAAGVESKRTFVVPNQVSDGNVTEDEIRMAVLEIARQGLPEGMTLVSDSFVLREGTSEGDWFTRNFGDESVRPMTGVAQFFRPRETSRVVTIPTVTVVGEAPPPIPTVRVEDLPRVDERGKRIPVVRVEDLPTARLSSADGIPTIDVKDLPRAKS